METQTSRADILVVDDTVANLRLLTSILQENGFKARAVTNGQMALTVTHTSPPDLILLDITMPDMNGYDVCEKLKENPQTRDIPIIFISALDATADKLKAFTTGGVDYITKPFQIEEVVARVQTHLSLRAMQRELEKTNAELLQSQRDLQARLDENELLRKELREQAIRDPLTGLFNRRYLQEYLDKEIPRADRDREPISIIMMDIDHFKNFNDSYGHKAGDLMLEKLGHLLLSETRQSDIACRYGGEEFLLALPNIHLDAAAERANELRNRYEQIIFPYDGQMLHSTISVGVASYPQQGQIVMEVVKRADKALYAAKAAGRNRVIIYADGV